MLKSLPIKLILLLSLALPAVAFAAEPARVVLAADGRSDYVIVLRALVSEQELLAANEIRSYMRRMCGAAPRAADSLDVDGVPRIFFEKGKYLGVDNLGSDGYAIAIRGDDVILAGDTGRARLYAAYDLLERLGCRWLAPQFGFYAGEAEVIPRTTKLVLE